MEARREEVSGTSGGTSSEGHPPARIRRRARESKALKFVHGRGKSAFAYLTTTVVPAGPAIASADIVGVASVRHVAPAIPDRDAPLTLDTVYSRVSKMRKHWSCRLRPPRCRERRRRQKGVVTKTTSASPPRHCARAHPHACRARRRASRARRAARRARRGAAPPRNPRPCSDGGPRFRSGSACSAVPCRPSLPGTMRTRSPSRLWAR